MLINKDLYFFLLFVTISITGFSQSIIGNSTATAGSTTSYSYISDGIYPSPSWAITNGETISTSQSGLTYTVNLKFTCEGPATVSFIDGSTTMATKSVTVSCPLVASPSTTFSYSNQCQSTTITRNSNPRLGTTWYWQTDPNGTRTDLGSGTTLTVTSNGTYYLRSLSDLATCCWGNSIPTQTISIVDQQTPIASNATRCGSGTVTLSATPGANGNTVRWYSASTGGSPFYEGLSYTTPSIIQSVTYYISSYNSSLICESSRIPITASVSSAPSSPSSASATPSEICGSGNVALSATGATGSEIYSWYLVPSGGTPLASTVQAISSNTTFYVARKNATTGCEGSRISASVIVNSAPTISINGSDHLAYGGSTQLSTGSFYSYQWCKNGVEISGATQPSLIVKEPGTYVVKTKKTSTSISCPSAENEIRSTMSDLPTQVNLVSTTRILKEGFASGSTAFTLQPSEVLQVIQYQDGLGRTFQSVGVGLSPSQGDIISPIAYGAQGRADSTFLPYTTVARDGRVRVNAIRSNSNQYTGSEQYLFYQNAVKVAHDPYPLAITKYRSIPEVSVNEQGAPGLEWQPGAHSIKNIISYNIANQVRVWNTDGTSNAFYGANELIIFQLTDENGNVTKSFADKQGRLILKQVQLDETIQGQSVPFLETYFIYDKYNQLVYEVPPKAVAALGTGSSLTLANASVADLVFNYVYDQKGRLIEKKVPGAATLYYIYDRLDRLVLTQDGNLRAANKWISLKYDAWNRVSYVSIYYNPTQTTRVSVQSLFDLRNYDAEPYYEIEETNVVYQGYSNRVFPTSNLTPISVNYYDHYDFDRNGTADYNYDNAHLPGQETYSSFNVRMLPTGNKQVILSDNSVSTNWLTNVVFYDQYDRPIQYQQNNHLYINGLDKTTLIYKFSGAVEQVKNTHRSSSSSSIDVVQRYVYDHTGRLLQIFQKNDSFAEVQVAEYEYNELGQLVDKKLHKNGSNFLQSVDYRYTIRGWLSSINNSKLDIDGANDELGDYFGMELLYNNREAGLNDFVNDKVYWNGNISAIKWKGPGAVSGLSDQNSYKFENDKTGKLKNATFQMSEGNVWATANGVFDERLTYDHNGNIKSLSRNQNQRGLAIINNIPTPTSTSQIIDNLSYSYHETNGNSLIKIEDASNNDVGFKNGVNVSEELTYDTNGSLTGDMNKGIDSVKYNILGKVRRIKFNDGRVIVYKYSSSGVKLSMSIIKSGVTTTTDYCNSFVYNNGILQFFASPEGRVVKNGSNYEFEYSIADHQGNTRIVFSSVAPPATTPQTGFESSGVFENDDKGISLQTVMNHTAGGTKSQMLSGGYNSQVGVATSLKVYPGDKIKAEVYSKYRNSTSSNSNLTNFALALTGAFNVSSVSTGEMHNLYQGMNSFGSFAAVGDRPDDDLSPKGFITILIFDKNHNFLDAAWDQLDGSFNQGTDIVNNFPFDLLQQEVTIKEEGYVYVFVSNENSTQVDIHFDDFKITHTKSNVIQYNEYYPFGLQTSNSWTRENSSNNFLYNSGTELNNTTGIYETMFRGYDAALGRFMQVDPLAHVTPSLNPYQYAANNPVYFNDPLGLLVNPGFNADVWRMIESALNSVWEPSQMDMDGGGGFGGGGGGGSWESGGTFYYSNGVLVSSTTYGQYTTESNGVTQTYKWWGSSGNEGSWAPQSYEQSQAMVMANAINAIDMSNGWASTAVGSRSQAIAAASAQAGFDIAQLSNGLLLQEVIVRDSRLANNNGLNWTDAAGGVINIFGGATDISLYQLTKGGRQVSLASKGAYVGARSFSTKLGVVGLAVTGYDIYDQGLNTSRTLDVVMGAAAFIPVVGWGISGTYFIGNLITIGITGQSIGDHIQGGVTGQDGTKSWKPWGN